VEKTRSLLVVSDSVRSGTLLDRSSPLSAADLIFETVPIVYYRVMLSLELLLAVVLPSCSAILDPVLATSYPLLCNRSAHLSHQKTLSDLAVVRALKAMTVLYTAVHSPLVIAMRDVHDFGCWNVRLAPRNAQVLDQESVTSDLRASAGVVVGTRTSRHGRDSYAESSRDRSYTHRT
jgi:hypothetical protein